MIKPPKICHIYWGGNILPYMRLLTFKTFMKYNPDWEIWLWMPKDTANKVTWTSLENDYPLICNNFLPVLLNMPIKKCIMDFVKLGFNANMAEVHKADYTRIYALYEYGGAWIDTDIIFFKSMDDLVINIDINKNKDTFACLLHYGHSTGFLMATPQNDFFSKLMRVLKVEFNPTHYQCIGPGMFDKYFPTIQSIPNGANIPKNVVYKYDANCVKELINKQQPDFPNESIGCHWYGGNTLWADFIRKTNGGFMNISNSIISKLLKNEMSL